MKRYISYTRGIMAIQKKVVGALIYPAILAVVGLLVTLFLLGHVVPRFAGVYQGTGRELPWLSQQLIAWGAFAAGHGRALAVGAAVALLALVTGGRRWWRGAQQPRYP